MWWLDTPELNLLAHQEQEERYEPGVWDDIILEWADDPRQREDLSNGITIPVAPWDGSEPGKVTISDILIHAIGKDKDRLTQTDRNQVARCLDPRRLAAKARAARFPSRQTVLCEVRTMSRNMRNAFGTRTGTRAKSLTSLRGTHGTRMCAGVCRACASARGRVIPPNLPVPTCSKIPRPRKSTGGPQCST